MATLIPLDHRPVSDSHGMTTKKTMESEDVQRGRQKDARAGAGSQRSGSVGKKKKPADKPKRPLSAYNFFFKEERNKILKDLAAGADLESAGTHGNENALSSAKPSETHDPKRARIGDTNKAVPRRPPRFDVLAQMIGKRWKNIDPESLAKYKKKADEEMERYKIAMKEYNERKKKEALEASSKEVTEEACASAEKNEKIITEQNDIPPSSGSVRRVLAPPPPVGGTGVRSVGGVVPARRVGAAAVPVEAGGTMSVGNGNSIKIPYRNPYAPRPAVQPASLLKGNGNGSVLPDASCEREAELEEDVESTDYVLEQRRGTKGKRTADTMEENSLEKDSTNTSPQRTDRETDRVHAVHDTLQRNVEEMPQAVSQEATVRSLLVDGRSRETPRMPDVREHLVRAAQAGLGGMSYNNPFASPQERLAAAIAVERQRMVEAFDRAALAMVDEQRSALMAAAARERIAATYMDIDHPSIGQAGANLSINHGERLMHHNNGPIPVRLVHHQAAGVPYEQARAEQMVLLMARGARDGHPPSTELRR